MCFFVLNARPPRHKIAGWSIHREARTKEIIYEVRFERLAVESSMDTVLRRPFADEIEDYREYKRLRQLHRGQGMEIGNSRSEFVGPTRNVVTDGAVDEKDISELLREMGAEAESLWEESSHAEMLRHRLEFGRTDSAWE